MGQRDRAFYHGISLIPHVRLDKLQQIRRAGLDAIGLGRQHARIDPDGLVFLRIAVGIIRHGRLRHLDIGVMQTQLGQQGLAHQLLKWLAQTIRGQVTKQTYAGVGILAMGTRRVGWCPLAIVGTHLVGGIHLVGKLQRQTARTVGGEFGHGDAVEGRAFQPGRMLARLVLQLKTTLDRGIGAKGCGQCLADRTNFEQGLLADASSALPIRHPVVEVVRLAFFEHGDRHARNPVLLEQRLDGAIHQGRQGLGFFCMG